MSISRIALDEVKTVFEKVEAMQPREVTYAKESDNTGAMHVYTLDTVCNNGKVLSIELITNFTSMFNAQGASYSLRVSIVNGYQTATIHGQEIERHNITGAYIVTVLREKGLKI